MPPTPKAEPKETSKKSGKMYAWTTIRFGGEGELQPLPNGKDHRYVITKRNVIQQGDEVSQSDVGVDDETWQSWIDGGTVRPYPLPEGTDDYTSPSQAFLAGVSTGKGEVDIDKLMELGLTNPAPGGYAEDEDAEEEVTEPVGA